MMFLQRFCYGPNGTFGHINVDGIILATVERPWLENRPMVSCIPEGEYKCRPRRFYRGGYDAIEVRDVPGRTHILFHRANLPSDVAGCIGVGSRLGTLYGQWAVLDSRSAFDLFMANFGGLKFTLNILGPPSALPTTSGTGAS